MEQLCGEEKAVVLQTGYSRAYSRLADSSAALSKIGSMAYRSYWFRYVREYRFTIETIACIVAL